MVGFILKGLNESLLQYGLYHAVRVVGLLRAIIIFFTMLEKYNLDSCTFFTLVGEMGFALHERCEVSGLPMGDSPFEE